MCNVAAQGVKLQSENESEERAQVTAADYVNLCIYDKTKNSLRPREIVDTEKTFHARIQIVEGDEFVGDAAIYKLEQAPECHAYWSLGYMFDAIGATGRYVGDHLPFYEKILAHL